jgi:hypothetical protein
MVSKKFLQGMVSKKIQLISEHRGIFETLSFHRRISFLLPENTVTDS